MKKESARTFAMAGIVAVLLGVAFYYAFRLGSQYATASWIKNEKGLWVIHCAGLLSDADDIVGTETHARLEYALMTEVVKLDTILRAEGTAFIDREAIQWALDNALIYFSLHPPKQNNLQEQIEEFRTRQQNSIDTGDETDAFLSQAVVENLVGVDATRQRFQEILTRFDPNRLAYTARTAYDYNKRKVEQKRKQKSEAQQDGGRQPATRPESN
jgi:hypothetical protein